MNRRKSNIVVMILLGLGALGFVYTLFTRPGSLLVQAGMIFLILGIIYLLYKFVIGRRMGGKENSAYLRAAKQSRKRFKTGSQRKSRTMGMGNKKPTTSAAKRSTVASIHKKRKTNTTHLTVIEGKKGKKKNRALF